jgi:hypothetical protein
VFSSCAVLRHYKATVDYELKHEQTQFHLHGAKRKYMLRTAKRKAEALHTVKTRLIAVNTANGQNRGLYLSSGQN